MVVGRCVRVPLGCGGLKGVEYNEDEVYESRCRRDEELDRTVMFYCIIV